MIRMTMNISKYTEGLGQEAKELPPNWRCFTEAEVERIVSLAVLDALNGRGTNELCQKEH
jgi:hypothetical protein